MDNSEKVATQGTQDVEKESKNKSQYVFDTTTETSTNNANRTWAILQTTGGKDELNIPAEGIIKQLPNLYHKSNDIKTHISL